MSLLRKINKHFGKSSLLKCALAFAVILLCFSLFKTTAMADDILPSINISVGTAQGQAEANRSLQILLVMTMITLSPYLLITLTCFTRIIISFHFLRAALGTQQMPPNQILLALALFLTLFLMGPSLTVINETAVQPFQNGELTQTEALQAGMRPIREFMLKQVEVKDLDMFSEMAQLEPYDSYEQALEELPNSVLIPAFLLGEITKGFKIGVILYVPFIVIDMVVASTLMAMGMMMLPPAMISLPFKILFFVMVDGWDLVIQSIIMTFN